MGTVEIDIDRSRAEVWAGVTDAESYPDWLIGAQEVEAPDEWPHPGAAFDHRIGIGPLRLPGTTTSREVDEPARFRLTAGMGPLGEADVSFELEDLGPSRTRVTMSEHPSDGLAQACDRLAHPVVDRLVDRRNTASLERLRDHLISR